ncbi:MAG TPA: AAA family ATPase [Phycisphaerales bacterium]|nr:AAA family ATPase [Phycisphaerales bacterium]
MHDTDQSRFEALLRARHPSILIITSEEAEALQMVRRAAHSTGKGMKVWSVVRGLWDGLLDKAEPVAHTENAAAALYVAATETTPQVVVMLDLLAHLSDARTLRCWRDAVEWYRAGAALCEGMSGGGGDGHVVLIDHAAEVPAVVAAHSARFELTLPGEDEIERLVKRTLRAAHRQRPIEAGLSKAGLRTVVRNLRGLTRRQVERLVYETVCDDRKFDERDVAAVLARKRELLHSGGLLEFVDAPTSLDEIGGLERLKAWLKQREMGLSEEAAEHGVPPPRGVLLLGVQGAGKSLCAKAVATAWQRPLLRMDVGALYDRYIGESERRLRESLGQAEAMAPVVLWIDEIEKAFASAASRSTDGGLSQRMFGMLLTWMQEHRAPVFLVATANDIEALPPELLRKGRFDEIFFVDLPGPAARKQIFEVHLRRRKQDPGVLDLDRLVAASEGHSGAEIEQAVISGLFRSFSERRALDARMLVGALEGSPPLSVTMAERMGALREWARGRCVPAG